MFRPKINNHLEFYHQRAYLHQLDLLPATERLGFATYCQAGFAHDVLSHLLLHMLEQITPYTQHISYVLVKGVQCTLSHRVDSGQQKKVPPQTANPHAETTALEDKTTVDSLQIRSPSANL
jgi:hypothetical protein